jgi:DNA-binding XRE family transcriptional regulator
MSQQSSQAKFNPYRFLMAREVAGLSQVELAEKLELNELDIIAIEGGYYEVDRALVLSAGMVMGFPEAWFYKPNPPEFGQPICPAFHGNVDGKR